MRPESVSKKLLTDSLILSFDIEVYLPIQNLVNKSDSNWKADKKKVKNLKKSKIANSLNGAQQYVLKIWFE